MATSHTDGSDFLVGLPDLIATYKQLSALSAALFAPVARTYVGHLTPRGEHQLDDPDTVNLALRKMAFEAGELLAARFPVTDKETQRFEPDEEGRLPDLKLVHAASAILGLLQHRDNARAARDAKREKQQSMHAQPPATYSLAAFRSSRGAPNVRVANRSGFAAATGFTRAPTPMTVPVAKRMTGGCGCGGGCSGGCGCRTHEPPGGAIPPCYDPCGGGLVPPVVADPCGQPCPPCPVPTPPEDCDDACSISCETKLRLRHCVKALLCDLIRYIEYVLYRNSPNPPPAIDLGDVVRRTLACVREALCLSSPQPCLQAPSSLPCLPCSYAVENS